MSLPSSASPTANNFEAADLRVSRYDWPTLSQDLSTHGCAVLNNLLSVEESMEAAELYLDKQRFRSHITMARHGFGRGEYQYFSYPLPGMVAGLRKALYPRLATVANKWQEQLRLHPPITRHSSSNATHRGRPDRRRCCCNMWRVTSTACTRISMAILPFPSRWQSCSPNPTATSPAASSC